MLGHRLDAAGEDPVGLLVVPVVQDVEQQVGVAAGRQRVEEAAAGHLGAITEQLPCARGGLLQVDQVAASMLDTEKTMNELQFVTGLNAVEEAPSLLQGEVPVPRRVKQTS